MKLWIFTASALALAACAQPAPTAPEAPPAPVVNAPTGAYTIDPTHTTVTVRVNHFGLSTYTLRFNDVSGTLNFNAEDPTQSSVEATVAIASLDTPYNGPRDFDAELQNSEWLDAAAFPTATFRSTGVESTGPGTARMTGDVTIHGVTAPVTFDVTYNGSYAQHPFGMPISLIGFSARGEISRTAFGVTQYVPADGSSQGVGDTVELLIEAEFTRPVESAAAPAPAN
jgi:polyisoprenoid-binding protein YceI